MQASNLSDKGWSEFRAGWRAVVAGLMAMIFGAPGLAYYSIGIFAPVLARNFGWSFSFILSGLSIMMFALLPIGPVMGYIVDRFGARFVGAVSMALFGVSYMALGLTTGSKIQYIATWLFIALFGVGATPIVSTRAINSLFRRRRGLALGIALMGSGFLIVMLKLSGQHLVQAVGWRGAFVVLGALPLLFAAPVIVWGFPGRNVTASGDKSSEARRPTAGGNAGLSVREVLTGMRFWIIVASFLPTAFAGAASMANMENILRSAAVPSSEIPGITALIGVGLIIGRLAGGWVIDRVWAPFVTFLFTVAGAYGCFLLSHSSLTHGEAVAAVCLLGAGAGIELDLLSYMVVRYMGLKCYGVIYGLLYASFFIAAGLGPSLMAHSFDRTGSYESISLLFCGLLSFASAVVLLMGPYPDFTLTRGRDMSNETVSG